ncbi:hypothetical protein V6N11_037866 [Hibiscus sabdariffa]|uniref:Uncharacterized protein n=2 Tax=Hibiscus sabdariffa TaxID=183260 RepID=A0ABR2AML2_9ROSI
MSEPCHVNTFVNSDNEWNIEALSEALPSDCIRFIFTIYPPSMDLGVDFIVEQMVSTNSATRIVDTAPTRLEDISQS